MNDLYGAAALNKAVAEKYEVVNWSGGHVQNFGKLGIVDLSKLTIPDADALVKKGFVKLRLKTPQKAEEAKAPADKK